MKIETSIKILNKEREFLGMSFLDLLFDIQKEGRFRRMVYSQKVIEAFDLFTMGNSTLALVLQNNNRALDNFATCDTIHP